LSRAGGDGPCHVIKDPIPRATTRKANACGGYAQKRAKQHNKKKDKTSTNRGSPKKFVRKMSPLSEGLPSSSP